MKRAGPLMKKPFQINDLCEESVAYLQDSFERFFETQSDLKNFINKTMENVGTTQYNRLASQTLFPRDGPLMVDLKEPELRDAFCTGSLCQYTEVVDEQLGSSVKRTAGN